MNKTLPFEKKVPVDKAGRYTVPSKLRKNFNLQPGDEIVSLCLGKTGVALMTRSHFDKIVKDFHETFPGDKHTDKYVRRIHRRFFSNAYVDKYDERGRTLVPSDMQSKTGINAGDTINLTDKEDYILVSKIDKGDKYERSTKN